ncbi:dienelactone hydrolase family protein [candidate division KSB1 bacterium]|nr:dienelactone hydrolase family protein [candidate division KSB1 bacterium]
MKNVRYLILFIAITIFCSCPTPPEPTLEITGYKFFIRLPDDYEGEDQWPLILFLHGRGCGTIDYLVYASWGLGAHADTCANFPFIIIAPQTSDDWSPDILSDLLEDVSQNYKVDTDRIYVTGFSMGGSGTYHLAFAFPQRFAAIAPICGWGNTSQACSIAHLPIWIFHNIGDPTIPIQHSYDMADSLTQCGATDLLTTYYNNDMHDAWTETYHNPQLYDWFLSHRRKD